MPDGGTDLQDWQSARDLNIADRAYDFIVDRKKQAWWPVEPGEQTTGYNGRWGTRVATDPLAGAPACVSRRSGKCFHGFDERQGRGRHL